MADAITIKALQDASLDAKSLEEVVNGNESKQVTTRLGESYPSVKKAINTLFENGGLPATPFATKALMTASSLVDGDYAQVTDDTVNNGLYVKTAGAWVKSGYDPVVQAKTYTDDVSNSMGYIGYTLSNNITVNHEDKTISVGDGVRVFYLKGSFLVEKATIDYSAVWEGANKYRYLIINKDNGVAELVQGSDIATLAANKIIIGAFTKSQKGDFAELVMVGADVRELFRPDTDEPIVEGFNLAIALHNTGDTRLDHNTKELKFYTGLRILTKGETYTQPTDTIFSYEGLSSGFHVVIADHTTKTLALKRVSELSTLKANESFIARLQVYPDARLPVLTVNFGTFTEIGLPDPLYTYKPVEMGNGIYKTLISTSHMGHTDTDPVPLVSIDSTIVYGWYDELVSTYPDYVTKELLGKDASGTLDIYAYRFNPTRINRPTGFTADMTRVQILALHNEQVNFVYPYYLMKNICENWDKNEALAELRFSVEFLVIPVLNPYGLDNKQRVNSNGIDLNRNFPAHWSLITSPPTHVSGSAPLTEVEAQYAYSTMQTFKPHIYIDCHSYGGWINEGRSIYVTTSSQNDAAFTGSAILRTYRNTKKDNPWLVDIESFADSFRYTGGTSAIAASSLNIIATNLEAAWSLKDEPSGEKGSALAVKHATELLGNCVLEGMSVLKNQGSEWYNINQE